MLKKYLIIIGAVVFLIGASVTASAVTDSTGDLFHALENGGYEVYNNQKDDIDITDISYTTSETQVTVTLTVKGEIQNTSLFGYFVYIASEGIDGFDYFASYTNGIGYVFDTTPTDHLVTKDSNTLTFVFDLEDPSSIVNAWAWAYESASYESEESWLDWAPDTYFPAYDDFYGSSNDGEDPSEEGNGETTDEGDGTTTGEEDGTNGEDTTEGGEENSGSEKTPGFEILTLVASVAIALILLRKRK